MSEVKIASLQGLMPGVENHFSPGFDAQSGKIISVRGSMSGVENHLSSGFDALSGNLFLPGV